MTKDLGRDTNNAVFAVFDLARVSFSAFESLVDIGPLGVDNVVVAVSRPFCLGLFSLEVFCYLSVRQIGDYRGGVSGIALYL